VWLPACYGLLHRPANSRLLSSIKVTTILDDTITGQLYSYDPLTSTITLLTTANTHYGPQDIRILKISFLKDVSVLAPALNPAKGFSATEPKIGRVNLGAIVAKENEAMREEQRRMMRVGKGVTKEGQDIFDALSRTMPCRWHEKQIVVLDSVLISEPYALADVKGNDQNAVKRVKTVLEGERRKLESGKRTGNNTPVPGERKGG